MPVAVALLRGAAPTIATATDEGGKLLLEQRLDGRTDVLPQPILDRIRPVSARFQVFSACQFQGMSSSMRLIL